MNPPLNGWRIFIHRDLYERLEELSASIMWMDTAGETTKKDRRRRQKAKAISRVMREVVPRDPGAAEFRLGHTLGDSNTTWFRAKFLMQYRLFYRFDSSSRIIVFAWLNDENSSRAYGSKTDAYEVFRRRLANGNPPSSFEELLKQSREI